MALTGMDIDQVQTLSTSMQKHSDEINQACTQLTQQLESTQWFGQDQVKFKDEWASNYSAQLRNVVQALQDRSTELKTQMDQQTQASGA